MLLQTHVNVFGARWYELVHRGGINLAFVSADTVTCIPGRRRPPWRHGLESRPPLQSPPASAPSAADNDDDTSDAIKSSATRQRFTLGDAFWYRNCPGLPFA